MKPNVELHIEELVLHGFASGDRYRIGKAVESELARLFDEQGNPLARGGYLGRLDGGSFETKPDSSPEAIGIRVAQATFQSLGQ